MTPQAQAADRYADVALQRAHADVLNAVNGTRNATLSSAAFGLARLAAADRLDWQHAARELEQAALHVGLKPAEIRDTLKSARRAGAANPNHEGQRQHGPSKAVYQPVARPQIARQGVNPADVWGRCEAATEQHAYVTKKRAAGVPLDDLRVLPADDALRIAGNRMASALAVPAYADDGTLQSLQLIPPEGKKMNLPGCPMAGASHVVGTPEPGAPLYVVEGIGQAWAIWQATGRAAICCFGWGNVGAVAAAIRNKDNATRLVIVPDAGKEESAEKIASELGCSVAFMPEGEPQNFDCNDLAQRDGYDVLAELLECAQDFAAEPVDPDTGEHPLAKIVDMQDGLRPPAWLLPGFFVEGLTVIAGQPGIGKTTAMLPLACGVAGIHGAAWAMSPKHWRHVVYVTEDVPQALRILHGLAGHLGISAQTIAERLHLVEAHSMPAADLVRVGRTYRERYSRTVEDVELLPLVVLDTQAATIHLENENDNAEASAAVAALKQRFEGLPVWLVAHVAKTHLNRSDVENFSSRGASAWDANAHATAFLVKDAGERWLVLGKRRFEPRWREAQLESHWQEVQAPDLWGEPEQVFLRWAVARPAESRKEHAAMAKQTQAQDDEAQLRQEIRDAVQIAWQQGHPLSRAAARATIKRKTTEVVACIDRLVHEGWLQVVHVPREIRAHPSRADFLVNLSTDERENVRRGQPLPPEKSAIPDSWKKAIPPVPERNDKSAQKEKKEGDL